ncbi:MAG TPA: HAD family hydrolase [Bacilli bacterium]|nr:HAD family hydrolase [Bacilli bacterium]
MKQYRLIPSDVRTIVFDWDGTLHESMHIYKPAFIKAYDYLVKHKIAQKKVWENSEIEAFLGKNPKEMWESFTPKLSSNTIEKVSTIISKHMLTLIKKRKAKLYDGALDVLRELKRNGFVLVYLSNSKTYYMEAMREAFHLDEFFDFMQCSEMYDYIPKPEILKKIKSVLPQKILMVGDRYLDIDTGVENGAHTIGCLYGYGTMEELNRADNHIKSILELIKV